jgi:hypothetical protein
MLNENLQKIAAGISINVICQPFFGSKRASAEATASSSLQTNSLVTP